MIDKIIRLETMEEDNHIMQKLILLSIFSIGFFVANKSGQHMTFSFGIGPIEMEWGIRLWLTETK